MRFGDAHHTSVGRGSSRRSQTFVIQTAPRGSALVVGPRQAALEIAEPLEKARFRVTLVFDLSHGFLVACDLWPDVVAMALGRLSVEEQSKLVLAVSRFVPGVGVVVLGDQLSDTRVAVLKKAGAAEVLSRPVSGECIAAAAAQAAQRSRVARRISTESLTSSEWQIIRRVEAGETNKEIAQGLGQQESTVEGHLRMIYRLVGVTNREALSAWAKGPQRVDPDCGLESECLRRREER